MENILANAGAFLPIILLFVFFYFFIIRPQSKQQKQIKQMREDLKKGDKIITIGGFHGKIVTIREDKVTLELKPDNVKVVVGKNAIANVLSEEEK